MFTKKEKTTILHSPNENEKEKAILAAELKEIKQRMRINILKSATVWFILLIEVIILIAVLKSYGFMPDAHEKKIAVINVNKIITTKYIHKLSKAVEDALKDEQVKEILVTLNSPGGSPTASDDFSELLKYASTKKPVTMYVESIAASGGYYIASAIKPINANRNAIAGSIGVIMPHYVIGDLAKKIGVQEDDIAVGKYKKPISLFKEATDEERKYLKKHLLLPTYKAFVATMAKNRGLSIEEMEKYSDGKIWSASSPEIKGVLVDNITNLHVLKNKILEKNPGAVFEYMPREKKSLFSGMKASVDFNVDTASGSIELR